MDLSEKMLCQANRKDNGHLVVGYYFCMHHNDNRKHVHHFVIPLEADLSIGTPIEKIQVEIDPDTVHLKLLEKQILLVPYTDGSTTLWNGNLYCRGCGWGILRESIYCPHCGRAINWMDD